MKRLRVCMYHKVSEGHKDFLTVDRMQFNEQIEFLSKHYNLISFSDLNSYLQDKKSLPDNALLITFDDGYYDNFTNAYPILKKHNAPFGIFLVSEFIGKEVEHDGVIQKFLGVDELNEMKHLAQYACHSRRHENINNLSETDFTDEIKGCLNQLKALNIDLQPFWAYTYGAYPKKHPEKMQKLIKSFESCDIKAAFRIGNRINNLPLKAPFRIERLDIRGDEGFLKFSFKVRFGKIF